MKNPYLDSREPSPGEKEQEYGGLLLVVFKFLGVPMPKEGDAAAVSRTSILLLRWLRNRYPPLYKLLDRLTRKFMKEKGL